MVYIIMSLLKALFWPIVILFVIVCFMIKPGKKRDTSYFHTKMYAHRGLHDDNIPENSITAFREARKNGYGVELDVQMTKDGELVVFHDGNLRRVCGVDGFVRDYTYEELLQFRLNGTDECIPRFEDVLSELGQTDLICEIKGDNGNKNYILCEKTYLALLKYKGRFCIESFSPYLVGWFKKNHPEVIRGQLSCNFMDDGAMKKPIAFAMTHLLVNCISRPDFVAYKHQDVNNIGFKLCKGIFKPFLVAWTAKGEEEQRKAWGDFDSVIFEKNK